MRRTPVDWATDCYAKHKEIRVELSENSFVSITRSVSRERMLSENIRAESDAAEFKALLQTVF